MSLDRPTRNKRKFQSRGGRLREVPTEVISLGIFLDRWSLIVHVHISRKFVKEKNKKRKIGINDAANCFRFEIILLLLLLFFTDF